MGTTVYYCKGWRDQIGLGAGEARERPYFKLGLWDVPRDSGRGRRLTDCRLPPKPVPLDRFIQWYVYLKLNPLPQTFYFEKFPHLLSLIHAFSFCWESEGTFFTQLLLSPGFCRGQLWTRMFWFIAPLFFSLCFCMLLRYLLLLSLLRIFKAIKIRQLNQ